jgi:hypothetical protein
MAERAERLALLGKFDKFYKQRYNVVPQYNKWAEQWAADALIESYGIKFCYDLLEYYFDVAQNPTWKYFSNNAHEIFDKREMQLRDAEERKQRRETAKKWLNE